MKAFFIASAIFLISGCASQMDAFAGIGVIDEENSSFDNSRIVTLTPTWVAGGGDDYVTSTKVGARWSESNPEQVLLILEYSSSTNSSDVYKSYESISVNINSEKRNFPASGSTELQSSTYNTVTNTIYTESTAVVPMPLEYLRKMVEAEDVRIRFNSSHRYEDGIFSQETSSFGQDMAKARILEFLNKI